MAALAAIAGLAIKGRKLLIGIAVAEMIQPGQMVILDGGTTAPGIARHLQLELKATIVTHSPAIALELICRWRLEKGSPALLVEGQSSALGRGVNS